MFLTIHKNQKHKIFHISTHLDSSDAHRTSTYISRARQNQKMFLLGKDSPGYDGFQCALVASGMNKDDWLDENITGIETEKQVKELRLQLISELEDQGYENVGGTRIGKKFSEKHFGVVFDKKPYNPNKETFMGTFGKITKILEEDGYNVPSNLLSKTYFTLVSKSEMTTKTDVMHYILDEVQYSEL